MSSRTDTEGTNAEDANDLEHLMAVYRQRLVRYAEGILGEVGNAEDVVQEAFLRLWLRRHELELTGSFRALFYAATRNAAFDECRRRARRAVAARRASPPSPTPTPLDTTMASELRGAAAGAVAALPPRRREVFMLARLHGLRHREIAASMDVSPQTVANQMSQALRTVREALVPYDISLS